MSVGLIGLLDDIAGIAKVAAVSLDDVAGMAMKAGLKASGAVIDDAAVTPKYLTGFARIASCRLLADRHRLDQEQADIPATCSPDPRLAPAWRHYPAADVGWGLSLL